METLLKTAAAVMGLFLIVPAVTWLATGSASRAWEAFRGYMLVIGILVGIGGAFSLIAILSRL